MSRYYERQYCGNCKHHKYDPADDKCFCVCKGSDYYMDYTEMDEVCESWEKKPVPVILR